MEAIGAVASILQIAQVGAQLSLTLYKIAETAGTANNDVRFVAKDIALFSAVLSNLGNALEKGKKSRLYRKDAYETSLRIVKECEDVFGEIQNILKKTTRDGVTLNDNISLPRVEKFLWIFRKSRIQLLRGNLECLKSTISLQLAVLNYADKVSNSSTSGNVHVDELLSLKSLVLANETAKSEFQALTISNIQGPSSENNPKNKNRGPEIFTGDSESVRKCADSFLSASVPPPDHGLGTSTSTGQSSAASKASTPSSVFVENSALTERYTQSWNLVDRLELALRKVKTAKWERERILQNIKSGPQGKNATISLSREADFLARLRNDLSKFGLSEGKVNQAIASLERHEAGIGIKAEVKHVMSKRDQTMEAFRLSGMAWESDEGYPGCWVMKRWMPEFLDDILWSHTYQSLMTFKPNNRTRNKNGVHWSLRENTTNVNFGGKLVSSSKTDKGKRNAIGMALPSGTRPTQTGISHYPNIREPPQSLLTSALAPIAGKAPTTLPKKLTNPGLHQVNNDRSPPNGQRPPMPNFQHPQGLPKEYHQQAFAPGPRAPPQPQPKHIKKERVHKWQEAIIDTSDSESESESVFDNSDTDTMPQMYAHMNGVMNPGFPERGPQYHAQPGAYQSPNPHYGAHPPPAPPHPFKPSAKHQLNGAFKHCLAHPDTRHGIHPGAYQGPQRIPNPGAQPGAYHSPNPHHGAIMGSNGKQLGQLNKSELADLIGRVVNEILDEDNNVIGRAIVTPKKAQEHADQIVEETTEKQVDPNHAKQQCSGPIDSLPIRPEGGPDIIHGERVEALERQRPRRRRKFYQDCKDSKAQKPSPITAFASVKRQYSQIHPDNTPGTFDPTTNHKQKSTEQRRKWFKTEADATTRTVDELLRKWTFVDM